MTDGHPARARALAILWLIAFCMCATATLAAPVIKNVKTDRVIYGPSDQIVVSVLISSVTPAVRVTADGVDLTRNGTTSQWQGPITGADEIGQHSITVDAYDAQGGTTRYDQCYYDTVRVFALGNSALFAPAAVSARSNYIFAVCGVVTVQDSTVFRVSDGSGVLVQVRAPNHGLSTGDSVRVQGAWIFVSPEPYLDSRTFDITRY